MLLVDDDVALKGTEQRTGARGLAGTIFIHKLVGAAAAEGKSSRRSGGNRQGRGSVAGYDGSFLFSGNLTLRRQAQF